MTWESETEKLADAATARPWPYSNWRSGNDGIMIWTAKGEGHGGLALLCGPNSQPETVQQHEDNAAFITHLANSEAELRALVAAARRAHSDCDAQPWHGFCCPVAAALAALDAKVQP